jgi:hypothetical protein
MSGPVRLLMNADNHSPGTTEDTMQVFVENHLPRGSADGILRLVDSAGNVIATFEDDVSEETAEYIAACVNQADATGRLPNR